MNMGLKRYEKVGETALSTTDEYLEGAGKDIHNLENNDTKLHFHYVKSTIMKGYHDFIQPDQTNTKSNAGWGPSNPIPQILPGR
jgi:hypothetical protein